MDGNLPLNKAREICSMIIVVRNAFHENSKYNPEADRIDVSEGIFVNKTSE